MKTVNLYRSPTTEDGTFGFLCVEGRYWRTIELPDKDNKPNVSCIPTGEYLVKKRYSPSFKRELYHVKKVPNRSWILIHSGNFAGDKSKGKQSHFLGCIGLGKRVASITNKFGNKQKAILNSRVAEREFMDYMNKEDFKLVIKEM